MNPTTPDKCPGCGCVASTHSKIGTYYVCDTLRFSDDGIVQSKRCTTNQRDQLAEKLRRLEEAGDRMAADLNRQCAPHWEDSLARLWRAAKTGGRPVDQAEASACAVIQDERMEA